MSGIVLEEKRQKYQLIKEQVESQILSEEEIAEKVKSYEQEIRQMNELAHCDLIKCNHYLELIDELLESSEPDSEYKPEI